MCHYDVNKVGIAVSVEQLWDLSTDDTINTVLALQLFKEEKKVDFLFKQLIHYVIFTTFSQFCVFVGEILLWYTSYFLHIAVISPLVCATVQYEKVASIFLLYSLFTYST